MDLDHLCYTVHAYVLGYEIFSRKNRPSICQVRFMTSDWIFFEMQVLCSARSRQRHFLVSYLLFSSLISLSPLLLTCSLILSSGFSLLHSPSYWKSYRSSQILALASKLISQWPIYTKSPLQVFKKINPKHFKQFWPFKHKRP